MRQQQPKVRRAVAADCEAIAGFNQAMAMETEGHALDPATINAGVAAALTDPDKGFYLVAEMDGQPAACLMITYEWSDWRNAWFWWIQSVYVVPEFRRQGLYRTLYQAARDLAREQGDVCGFRLYADNDNHRAHDTYQALGMDRCRYQMFEDLVDPQDGSSEVGASKA
ncbi:MAG: GNAT family N-acetyltransferase [Xanthomonadales bacterium]|nr:GNAT family N-acetyltransferase [Xanthomonadales bacterium]